MQLARLGVATLGFVLSATAAHAAVTISSGTTANMTCTSGVCAPTAKDAVLNVGDLEALLASGNVTVTTTGTGVQASDINVKSALSWSSTGVLSLLANKSIAIDQPVSIAGLSGLTIQTGGKNGMLSFGKNGNVTFANLSSTLTINGAAYTLVGDLKTLASDIGANPSGNFALATDYDASQGGSYSVATTFYGTFEGLGNVISNMIPGTYSGTRAETVVNVGLFAEVGATGVVKDIGLTNASISVVKQKGVHALRYVGTLAGTNSGTILSSYATGTITDKLGAYDGGLVSQNYGTIASSHAAVAITISAKKGGATAGGLADVNFGTVGTSYATGVISGCAAGGLVRYNFTGGTIVDSYATGNVPASNIVGYVGCVRGGLVGYNNGSIASSYATGAVSGGKAGAPQVGGFVGQLMGGTITSSYSTGAVMGGEGSSIGGFVGYDQSSPGSLTDTYWDTETSGITNLSQGAGNIADDPGITGLTTTQFQAGLPAGFDPKVWAEKAKIDDGFPYLLANKPVK